MKKILSLFLLLLTLQTLQAQEKYLDSLFTLKPVTTEIYAEKDGEQLIVDVYEPENSDKNRPLIIFMHGGGFAGGSPKNEAEVKFAETAAKKGYVVGLISYRLVRKGKGFGCDFNAEGKIETFRLAAEDFMDAAIFMKSNAEKYNIDSEKIIIGGSSAGAEAVLDAVYNPDLMFPQEKKYKDLHFSAVISLAGAIVDSRYLTEQNSIPGIFFHGTSDQLVPFATAAHHYCDPENPGYLILDGAETIVKKLKALDESYLLYSFEGAGHEISGMPFEYFPQIFLFLKQVALENSKIQSHIFK